MYCFQFSDGDNWGEDNRECLQLLVDTLLPVCNLFCYGQVHSPYGSGDLPQGTPPCRAGVRATRPQRDR
ncbi:MAG: DUF444 family protein [Planctomycetaceae bacterium]